MIAMAVDAIDSRWLDKPYVETNPTIAASNVAGPAVSAGGIAYKIIARNTKASATDFRLRLTPIDVVMDTVNRLAASVRIKRTTQANNPELVRRGRRAVVKSAEKNRITPSVEMPMRSRLLRQSLVTVILLVPCDFRLRKEPARRALQGRDLRDVGLLVLIVNQQRLAEVKITFPAPCGQGLSLPILYRNIQNRMSVTVTVYPAVAARAFNWVANS